MTPLFKENEKENIVIPGEYLGVIEEFDTSTTKNCYEQDGQIFSESWGIAKIDNKHQLKITPRKRIRNPRPGTIALGIVTEIRKQSASVTLTHFRFEKEKSFVSLNDNFSALLHISNLSDRYIRVLYDAVRPADYILCKILATKPEFRVGLFGSRELGVIYAICYACGKEITRSIKRNLLKCNNCGATQPRVLSSHFGHLEKL
ncbi:MAG: exosome complex RNA-binding protein Csl4 [Candidatus Thorarchaeota archaeon]